MRAIFLNSWYAKAGRSFYDFIVENSKDTDIFGLSEINPKLFSGLRRILPEFNSFYQKGIFDKNMRSIYGQAIFVRNGIRFDVLNKIDSPRDNYDEPAFGFALCLELGIKSKKLNFVNVHGKSRPGDKLDTPARIKQSENIIDFLRDKDGSVIVGGDFNLLPDTQSIRMFEESGYRNLIKDFDIEETRNRLSWEQFPNKEKQHFADFCFVSKGIKVKNFEVPKIEISDHLPLILDFEI